MDIKEHQTYRAAVAVCCETIPMLFGRSVQHRMPHGVLPSPAKPLNGCINGLITNQAGREQGDEVATFGRHRTTTLPVAIA